MNPTCNTQFGLDLAKIKIFVFLEISYILKFSKQSVRGLLFTEIKLKQNN